MSAARFFLRSAAGRATGRAAGSTLRSSTGIKSKPASMRSMFQMSKQTPLSHRIFRSPVELSSCVETMMPYHTATASALLNSMLSVSSSSSIWTPEACNDDA